MNVTVTEIAGKSNTSHDGCQEREEQELTVDSHCFENFNETSYVESCSFYIEVRPDWTRQCHILSLQGVLLTCVCVLGILANTITIIVLSRYNVPSTFTNLLSSLAVIDTILLVVFLVDSGLERLEVDMEWYTHLIPVVHGIKVL